MANLSTFNSLIISTASTNTTTIHIVPDEPESDEAAIILVWTYVIGLTGSITCFVGTICNALSFGVLISKETRGSTSNMYPIALAVYDTSYLVICFFFSTLEFFYFGLTGKDDWFYAYVHGSYPVYNTFAAISLGGSTFTTTAFTLDRAIAVSSPLHWPSICTPFRVRVVLLAILVWSTLLNIPNMMSYEIYLWLDPDTNQTLLQWAGTDYLYSHFHTGVYINVLKPICESAIPMALIFSGNLVIILAVWRRGRGGGALQREKKQVDKASKETIKITRQAMVISQFTLIGRVLRVTSDTIMGTSSVLVCTLMCSTLNALSFYWNMLNAAVNLFFYCYFGEAFRKAFFKKYGCFRCIKDTTDARRDAESSRNK